MKNLVSELQRKSLDSQTSVSELLRMAKVVAVKLDLPDFRKWVDSELDGYKGSEIPEYRSLMGEMKGVNPFHGLIPVFFPDAGLAEACRTTRLGQKIAEIEDLAKADRPLQTMMADEQQMLLRKLFRQDVEFKLILPSSAFKGVIEAVRNAILNWSLELEQSGIRGEGMSFSDQDKELAHSAPVTYKIGSIGSFAGNMGSVNDHASVQVFANSEAHVEALKQLVQEFRSQATSFGLSMAAAQSLDQGLTELDEEARRAKPKSSTVTNILTSLKSILQSGASSLLVKGALFELDRYKSIFDHLENLL